MWQYSVNIREEPNVKSHSGIKLEKNESSNKVKSRNLTATLSGRAIVVTMVKVICAIISLNNNKVLKKYLLSLIFHVNLMPSIAIK